ncbi:uncharacterized protein MYCFIDRAFT_214458 [Pseudocercospora fijiensis CIRAD86]|uniref:Uncharacterized protein n=1 Tax=Pseudocercospora fijiensis (strain CIRAD86) TaxID=383855 RepID=M2ZB01_PSEFD|nr:uncharacterized protein MYCFIDRAFT_214458 [Pseudocercospora fijiensis CIRAD86]EME87025.1 hypothetical protein MYCFIDRAFT_214458 [Pseudocercospora fijiensis CIRAD86]
MDSDSHALNDIDMPEYPAPQVYSSRHLDPSILELDANQAVALGLPAVPLQRLPFDDDCGGSRWVEKEDFENAHHRDLFRLPTLNEASTKLSTSAEREEDVNVDKVIGETQQLGTGARQDSVFERYKRRQDFDEDSVMMGQPENNQDTARVRKRIKRDHQLASPTTANSLYTQQVNLKLEAKGSQHGSQTDPITIEDEEDAPQPTLNISQSDPDIIDSEPDEGDATSTITTNPSSSRAPPGTWTTELRSLINELRRPNGPFNTNGISCAKIIKALYPNFTLSHLSDQELAKRVNAQWKERDYPNKADWVRIRGMRQQDAQLRDDLRARVRGTGILS